MNIKEELSLVEDIRILIPIEDVISKYVKLEKTGKNYVGLCPFHDEKTPSFTVSKQIFHCFGCHKGGNVFKFLMEYHNTSMTEALRILLDHLAEDIAVLSGKLSPKLELMKLHSKKIAKIVTSD